VRDIEVNYLLQRMEGFRGLAVLATNMRESLDQAFLRRLRHVPLPGRRTTPRDLAVRVPAKAHVEELDYDRLAHLPATGAMVQNIALNTAVHRRRAGRSRWPNVMHAARTEFEKLEKPVPAEALETPRPLGVVT
jgi:SpoVK/Ycf46/Vps4 family AAA+-type ATPase